MTDFGPTRPRAHPAAGPRPSGCPAPAASYLVRFAPEAADQLEDLHAYISAAATPAIASDYLDAIVDHCEGLAVFPHPVSPGTTSAPGYGSRRTRSA